MNLQLLGAYLRGEVLKPEDRIINNLGELALVVDYLRQSGFKITSTTGVWDLLHVGHCRYLAQTKKQGHISIVEIDSDEVVRARKPDNIHRPIVPLGERVEMLSFVSPVDLIYTLVEGEDPIEFIRVMKPDAFVVSETSQDSKDEYLDQVRPYCEEIVILPAQAGVSTTERVRRMMMAGAEERLVEVRDLISGMITALRNNHNHGETVISPVPSVTSPDINNERS